MRTSDKHPAILEQELLAEHGVRVHRKQIEKIVARRA
jgi:hypothetical protein